MEICKTVLLGLSCDMCHLCLEKSNLILKNIKLIGLCVVALCNEINSETQTRFSALHSYVRIMLILCDMLCLKSEVAIKIKVKKTAVL